ncbi:MAG: leucine-rich repeat domain-containing protein, partial [Clostridia bacterium]|nr:leucine-rich repeat domain-containing protein [Clostridia bacterium]
NAFERCKNLTEVKLNKKLEEINELAFYKCTSLKEITIPKSVKIIKECAFKYCESLTDVYIYNPELEFYIREEYQKEPGYGWEAIPSHVTIHGYKDSTAQKYAEEYGNKFVELD